MGYVYKYISKIDQRYYIGSHNGKNKNYKGSGLLWQRTIKKYGLETFDKIILYEGDDFRNQEEFILKELNAANDPMSYNMKNEALGGSFPGELNGMFRKKLTQNQKFVCGSGFRGKNRPEHSLRMQGNNNPMFGKTDQVHGLLTRSVNITGKSYEEIYGEEKAKIVKLKLSDSQRGKRHTLSLVICPHCHVSGQGPNMTRYHFNKCKEKTDC